MTAATVAAFFICFTANFSRFTAFAQEHPKEKLASFTTYFNQSDGGRCANIALAAARLDGIALQPYGELSFNAVVGKRTAENGFQQAKIISQGEFVLGIGGGVCQVSTTLYNAALLSGLAVTEFHPHSLAVAYVAPSRDAMVSSASDLRLYNPLSETVYFSVRVSQGALTVTLRGEKSARTYEIESRTIETVSPPEPLVTEEAGVKEREGKDGVRSEAYLKTYHGGVLVGVKRLRADTYAPVRGIINKKTINTTKKSSSNPCVFFEKML